MYITQLWPESENCYKNTWIIFLDDIIQVQTGNLDF